MKTDKILEQLAEQKELKAQAKAKLRQRTLADIKISDKVSTLDIIEALEDHECHVHIVEESPDWIDVEDKG